MADLDVLITASAPAEAPKIDEVPKWGMLEKPNFTMPFNLTGLPALSVCTGYGAGGLPVSMQIVGKPFAEATVFRAGHAYEMATTWRSKRPTMSTASKPEPPPRRTGRTKPPQCVNARSNKKQDPFSQRRRMGFVGLTENTR